jgi:Transposase
MKRARFTEEQIISVLREQEAGAKTVDLARKHGVSEATLYNWKAKYGGMDVPEANRVAKDLGENEDWLFDVANEMDVEDGVIWVYGSGDDGAMAFTDFGIENLIDLIKIYKDDPTLLKR